MAGIIIQDACNLQDEESASRVALTGAGSRGCLSAEWKQPQLYILFLTIFPFYVTGKVRLAQYCRRESLSEVNPIALVSLLTLAGLIWRF